MFVPPIGLAAISLAHPVEHDAQDTVAALLPVANEWLLLHLLLVPLFALLYVGLYSLVSDYQGWSALVARVAIAVSAFTAILIDAVNGVAIGLGLEEIAASDAVALDTAGPLLDGVFFDPLMSITALVAVLTYVIAVVALGVTLKQAGAPLPALALLVASVVGIASHVGVGGAIGMASLLGAHVWLEFFWTPHTDPLPHEEPVPGD